MFWATLIFGGFVIAVLCATLVAITVLFSRTLKASFLLTDNVHIRAQVHLSSVLDRFMALDFAQFKGFQLAEGAEGGEFLSPEEQNGGFERVRAPSPLPGLSLRPSDDEMRAAVENERRLIEEDFGDEP